MGFEVLWEITWIMSPRVDLHAQEARLASLLNPKRDFQVEISLSLIENNRLFPLLLVKAKSRDLVPDMHSEDFNGGLVAVGCDRQRTVHKILMLQVHQEKIKDLLREYILLPLQPHRTRIPVKDVVQDAQEKPSEHASPDKDIQDSEEVINKEGQHRDARR
ncbi:hypothetical protein Tco_0090608 [Tanacetum coccineum]